MTLLQTRLRWQQITRSGRPAQLKVALLATFTANPVVPYLGVALEDAGLPASLWMGPYNQIFQQCLAGDSETAHFQPDFLVCWPRLEELWSGRPLPLADEAAGYAADALELAEVCLDAAYRWQSTLVFVLPAVPEVRPLGAGDASNLWGVVATATTAREALRQLLAGRPGVRLVDSEEALRTIGSAGVYNDRLMALARIPFAETFFNLIAQAIASMIQLSRRPARKVLVLDGDNTLWGGVLGEEGPYGVDLADHGPGEAYRDFQAYLLELRRAGTLLALCSKNEPADIWALLERREMRLKKEQLAAWYIGWEAKSAGLLQIARTLSLDVHSFVLVDDNPAELAEVQAALPGVACLRMPDDPAQWRVVIQGAGVLDRLPPTAEDLERGKQYQQEQRRSQVLASSPTPAEYLANLGVEASIFPPTPATLPRLAQLVAKTNQLNLNGKRREESELARLAATDDYLVRLVQVQDHFGDYGIVGAFIVKIQADHADLDTFLLSCRAMGRGIEEAMIAELFAALAERGVGEVYATVEAQPRNEPARRFFARIGCEVAGLRARLERLVWPAYVRREKAA